VARSRFPAREAESGQLESDASAPGEPEDEVDPLAGPMAGAPDQVLVRFG
jgi:hypothetical protein